jgi:hypothetical protein
MAHFEGETSNPPESRSHGERSDAQDLDNVKMARPKGFEPLTPRFVVWCSIQLSYGRPGTDDYQSGSKAIRLAVPELHCNCLMRPIAIFWSRGTVFSHCRLLDSKICVGSGSQDLWGRVKRNVVLASGCGSASSIWPP